MASSMHPKIAGVERVVVCSVMELALRMMHTDC